MVPGRIPVTFRGVCCCFRKVSNSYRRTHC